MPECTPSGPPLSVPARDFSVTASLTVIYRHFSAIRDEDSKVFRNCIDASAIFRLYTRNLNPTFSGC